MRKCWLYAWVRCGRAAGTEVTCVDGATGCVGLSKTADRSSFLRSIDPQSKCLQDDKERFELAAWVKRQRVLWQQGNLTEDRIKLLSTLGFEPGVETAITDEWEYRFDQLVEWLLLLVTPFSFRRRLVAEISLCCKKRPVIALVDL